MTKQHTQSTKNSISTRKIAIENEGRNLSQSSYFAITIALLFCIVLFVVIFLRTNNIKVPTKINSSVEDIETPTEDSMQTGNVVTKQTKTAILDLDAYTGSNCNNLKSDLLSSDSRLVVTQDDENVWKAETSNGKSAVSIEYNSSIVKSIHMWDYPYLEGIQGEVCGKKQSELYDLMMDGGYWSIYEIYNNGQEAALREFGFNDNEIQSIISAIEYTDKYKQTDRDMLFIMNHQGIDFVLANVSEDSVVENIHVFLNN